MASLTLYVSVWTALIIFGVLLFPTDNSFTDLWKSLNTIYQNPITAIPNLVWGMFQGPNAPALIGLFIVAAGIPVINYLSGGGFTLLFVIPFVIVFGMISLYALPTQQIMNSPLPEEVKMIYVAFLGGLTILTAMTFMGGRN